MVAALAGGIIRPGDNNDLESRVAALETGRIKLYKSSATTLTNEGTLQPDAALTYALPINSVWAIEVVFMYKAPTANDAKVGFTWPTGATCPWGITGVDASLAVNDIGFDDTVASGAPFTVGGNGATNTMQLIVNGTIFMGANAGSLAFCYCQATAGVGTSIVANRGSRMTLERYA